jgi:hypothetical protein
MNARLLAIALFVATLVTVTLPSAAIRDRVPFAPRSNATGLVFVPWINEISILANDGRIVTIPPDFASQSSRAH